MNPYWRLPLWIPRWLRNVIVTLEYFDYEQHLQNIVVIAMKHYGKQRNELESIDILSIAEHLESAALAMGHSTQWLAWQCAHEDDDDNI